jgi:hypothetical protein
MIQCILGVEILHYCLLPPPPPKWGGGGYQNREHGSKVHMHTVVYVGHILAYIHCV